MSAVGLCLAHECMSPVLDLHMLCEWSHIIGVTLLEHYWRCHRIVSQGSLMVRLYRFPVRLELNLSEHKATTRLSS